MFSPFQDRISPLQHGSHQVPELFQQQTGVDRKTADTSAYIALKLHSVHRNVRNSLKIRMCPQSNSLDQTVEIGIKAENNIVNTVVTKKLAQVS